MDSDGTNQVNITNTPEHDQYPAWSPDGTKIVFVSDRGGEFDLWVMDADGTNVASLTHAPGGNFSPAWSPDGQRIAFSSSRDGDSEIYVMNANGSNQVRLTNSPGMDDEPAWSPDGGKIAFSARRESNSQVYVMNADGSNQINLTNDIEEDASPSWSPDGSKIVYWSTSGIFVMSAYGGNKTRLTSSLDDGVPAWSPDGTKIAFGRVTQPNANYEIFVMDADGSNQTNITSNPAFDLRPDWQRILLGTPTPTPTPPAQALNISTRVLVQAGDNAGIGGFIVTGTDPKQLVLEGLGPSLGSFGIPNPLADPLLELHGPSGFVTISNDNWQDGTCYPWPFGEPHLNSLESAICTTLDPGAYTAIIKGNNQTSGVGLVGVYDVGTASSSKLANLSTRAFVSTGGDIVIAGFILGNNNRQDSIILRGIGPSLAAFGVPNALANPQLELRDNSGTLIRSDNDWMDDPAQKALIVAAGLSPANDLESAIAETLSPGTYTALLSGVDNGTGVGLVEFYDLGTP